MSPEKMSAEKGISRRAMLVKLGLLLNGIVGAFLAVPVVRYLLSPVIRERKSGYESWLSLGGLEQFPAGQTRLATYKNPVVNAWDGETADIACWVRNVDDQTFQVFAINCAHLGCPVRWFPQSSLFMCPCHGGAYYQDGSRASGPPERGLFEYHYKIAVGSSLLRPARCLHQAKLQTSLERYARASDQIDRRLAGRAPSTWLHHPRDCRAFRSARNRELVLCFRQRCLRRVHASNRYGYHVGAHLRAFRGRSLEQPPDSQSQRHLGLVHSRLARMGFGLHGCNRSDPYGPSLLVRRVQASARTNLDCRRFSLARDSWHGLHRPSSQI